MRIGAGAKGEAKVGLMSYVDVFGSVRNSADGQPAAWSCVYFVLAMAWLILAFWGSRRVGRGD